MTKIEEKIDKASESFINTCLNRCRFRDKRMQQFDAYDLETAFEQGAEWMLSHQWVGVEEALPPYDTDVLGTEDDYVYMCKRQRMCDGEDVYIINDAGDFSPVYWMPIPPLPEARKEGEV